MGKEKKSGVERLVQYLYDGSPHIAKAKKMGLAPGLDDDMTGDGATAHAWNNQATGPMRLNHKKTSRPLEDALQTAENNEPHVNMGLAGNMEAGVAATYPRHDSVNSVGNAQTQRKPSWGKDNSYVQKAEFHEDTKPFWHPENDMWNGVQPGPVWHSPPTDRPSDALHGLIGYRAGNHKHGLLQNQFDRFAEHTGTSSPIVPAWEPEETWSNLSLLELGEAHHPDPNFAKWQQDDWARAEDHRPLDSNRDLKDAFKREYPDMIEDALRKAANEATTMTSPTENKPWSLTDPQDKFVERAGDNPNEPPAKDAVIKENDWEKRVKSYDDKASRRDGGQEQPAGSMAAAGMGRYPSGAAMQMSSFGSGPDTFAQDALARGGDKDMEDPEIAQEESDAMWIPEAEKVAKLEAMRKMIEDEGDETPLISALFAVDGE